MKLYISNEGIHHECSWNNGYHSEIVTYLNSVYTLKGDILYCASTYPCSLKFPSLLMLPFKIFKANEYLYIGTNAINKKDFIGEIIELDETLYS